jgi:hypothetical protein
MFDKLRYWITPNGELVDVPDSHERVLMRLAGLSKEDAFRDGWIRVIRDDKFSRYWYFEIQNPYDNETLELIEGFIVSPENKQTGEDVAASISILEPKKMSFPIYWKDLEDYSFVEAAEKSFRREVSRKEGYRWYELGRNPKRRPRR